MVTLQRLVKMDVGERERRSRDDARLYLVVVID